MAESPKDPWSRLAHRTPARIGLGRAGMSLPTREVLALAEAHAMARDAVQARLDIGGLEAALAAAGLETIGVSSATTSRAHYLTRPDLGRQLDEASRRRVRERAGRFDLAIVIADGLSAPAVERSAVAVLGPLLQHLAGQAPAVAPIIVAQGGRVALGDDVAACLGAKAVLVLIGERPGLSSPDSLGAYLTFGPDFSPAAGRRTYADRNCVSNIRPEGLPANEAAARLAWLLREAFRRGITGVALKDESDAGLVARDGAAIEKPNGSGSS